MTYFLRYFFSSSLCLGLLMMGFSNTAFAQESEIQETDKLSAVFACRSKPNPTERLACYDVTVGQFEQAQKIGDVIIVSKSQIEQVEKDSFGFNIPSLPNLGSIFGSGKKKEIEENDLTAPIISQDVKASAIEDKTEPRAAKVLKEKQIKEIDENIRRVQTFGYEKLRIFLENGQVWEQTDSKKIRVPKVRNNVPNTANIQQASLGSFLLRINGNGRAIRVRRVR